MAGPTRARPAPPRVASQPRRRPPHIPARALGNRGRSFLPAGKRKLRPQRNNFLFPPRPERPAGLAEALARPHRPAHCPRPSGVTSVRPERRRGLAGRSETGVGTLISQ